ncbi:MAG: acyltransferase [Holosporaceae bacterium]|nr:MAG: acyltransferase [Holosporaceae bacterium]
MALSKKVPFVPPNYFPHIDGLRGLSVLFVFLFHLFPHVFPGGFLGVDVFFVISGYLISKNIFEKLEQDRFSFLIFMHDVCVVFIQPSSSFVGFV